MQKLGLTLELGLDKILYATYIVSKTYSDIKVKFLTLKYSSGDMGIPQNC